MSLFSIFKSKLVKKQGGNMPPPPPPALPPSTELVLSPTRELLDQTASSASQFLTLAKDIKNLLENAKNLVSQSTHAHHHIVRIQFLNEDSHLLCEKLKKIFQSNSQLLDTDPELPVDIQVRFSVTKKEVQLAIEAFEKFQKTTAEIISSITETNKHLASQVKLIEQLKNSVQKLDAAQSSDPSKK